LVQESASRVPLAMYPGMCGLLGPPQIPG
jgi:hypothetical protein